MNGKDKQQVYGCIGVHLVLAHDVSTQFVKITMRTFIPVLDLKQCRCTLICALNYIFLEPVNTKNVMYLSIGYAHVLHCMIKPRLDLKSTH